jgi:hypothetical protein
MDEDFSQYFGFIKDEVEELATRYGGLNKIDEIKLWYNGYKYGNIEIYNPWSILNYLGRKFKPEPYWINTGENSLVFELLRDAKLTTNKNIINFIAGKPVKSGLNESINFKNLKNDNRSLWTFLLSSGYLKPVGNYQKSDPKKIYTLIPPNKEVKISLENLFSNEIARMDGVDDLIKCINALIRGDVNDFQKNCNECIYSILSGRDWYEFFYHGLIIGMVIIMKDRFDIRSQKESGDGYPDLLLVPKSKKDHSGLVIEFKRVRNLSKVKATQKKQIYSSFKEAFDQIINLNYQDALMKEKKVTDILKYVLVFSKKECHALLQVNEEKLLKSGDGSSITLKELNKF